MNIGHRACTWLERTAAVFLAGLAALQTACSLALVPAIEGGGRKGFDVVITQGEGVQKGVLVGVKSDSLVIIGAAGIVTVPVAEIRSVRVIRKLHKVSGGLIGAAAGAVLGLGAAAASGIKTDDWGEAIGAASLFMLGGMVPGAVAGVLLADQLAKDEVYDLSGRSGQDIEKILGRLRTIARVRDYR